MEIEKYSIKPDETKIDSYWKNYSSKEESRKVSDRIDWLLKNYLHEIAIGDYWSALYLDTHDNRLWEYALVDDYFDFYQRLKIIDKDTALSKYGYKDGKIVAGLKQAKPDLQLYKDKMEALRAMQDHTKRTGNEIAGVKATRGVDGVTGILVQNDPKNTPYSSRFDYGENDEGEKFVWDRLNRRYTLWEEYYHTHSNYNSMSQVSSDDIAAQASWSKPLNIIYGNRIWLLQQTKEGGFYYERTKIEF